MFQVGLLSKRLERYRRKPTSSSESKQGNSTLPWSNLQRESTTSVWLKAQMFDRTWENSIFSDRESSAMKPKPQMRDTFRPKKIAVTPTAAISIPNDMKFSIEFEENYCDCVFYFTSIKYWCGIRLNSLSRYLLEIKNICSISIKKISWVATKTSIKKGVIWRLVVLVDSYWWFDKKVPHPGIEPGPSEWESDILTI